MKNIIKFNPLLIDHLSGKQIDTGMRFDVSFLLEKPIQERQDTLLALTKGKRVIHVGCADHIEVIDKKITDGTHLHSLLIDNCERCLGLDINGHALEHLRINYGMEGLFCFDVCEGPFRTSNPYDYVLLGEMLEHVGDPVAFLKKVKENLQDSTEHIIITVPNAYSERHVKVYYEKGLEVINSDHRFWFTPYTLLKVMYEAGISIIDLMVADQCGNTPQASTTLVAIGNLSG